MIGPVREPQSGVRRGGDDLMLNHFPPFSPSSFFRGLSDTPNGPQCDAPWRHGSRRTGPIGMTLAHWSMEKGQMLGDSQETKMIKS